MISRERFDNVKAKWGAYSSWAVWRRIGPGDAPKKDIGDLSILDPVQNPALLESLNPNIVLLGLNAASRAIALEPWVNFHDSRSVANDFKIRFALEETPYWGAYMTDVLVGLHETDSARVNSWIKRDPVGVDKQAARLESELADIGAVDPLVVAFGGVAYDVLRVRLGKNYRIVKVTHYAHQVGKEKYRDEVLRVLDGATKEISA
ncbi:MAG: hypothetical protein ACR2OU_11930 [Thermomicrobiales bacterium]